MNIIITIVGYFFIVTGFIALPVALFELFKFAAQPKKVQDLNPQIPKKLMAGLARLMLWTLTGACIIKYLT